jgi:hypothetical protein
MRHDDPGGVALLCAHVLSRASPPLTDHLTTEELFNRLDAWLKTAAAIREAAETTKRVADLPSWLLELAREAGMEVPTG